MKLVVYICCSVSSLVHADFQPFIVQDIYKEGPPKSDLPSLSLTLFAYFTELLVLKQPLSKLSPAEQHLSQ